MELGIQNNVCNFCSSCAVVYIEQVIDIKAFAPLTEHSKLCVCEVGKKNSFYIWKNRVNMRKNIILYTVQFD
jgi:hypothetical protein